MTQNMSLGDIIIYTLFTNLPVHVTDTLRDVTYIKLN